MSSTLRTRRSPRLRNLVSGLLFGIGLAAFVDEVIFHQLLQWHHFYDRSTTSVGLFSDGLFHAFGWFAVVAGLFLFADLRRWHETLWQRWIGGVLLGAGVFQLYDGTVQHKLLGLHQIRYEVDLLAYDTVWNVIAGLLILAGAWLTCRTRTAVPRERETPADA
ncbi:MULTISPECIES: DUF2243 domain-containing protein [unclassified Arthrobacter]|uniref:DUF2243 domain-containing protein n=1 Tax=unclassified Arthrobacter TaxID=235627 RepID=UPI001E3FE2D3|nr:MULTISPECIES: DUF2243 domain-containing protein [unclassified Arthrobacter]MCC9145876.1 DUF2243 domain-containing protein [Arthrobacter sp. zg-Y919]MDK1277105.1 DUF2243 domain-containing protein [Arthrobacter sp. zg.Y919]WIB03628.1 DUF2243 domain-containing protein [Arthrobacter sp. zg-Y919]